ncbi:DUF4129 domain-containing protein [Halobiforma nitratireducens]|uniref:Protein-glutamine gamma-glutamyltransferase-like C-terminal domain-containing protein n=1 Tax=Halobiforma nitratireducens JCM 10879 TaxID=1227454 RepID=M0M8R0_9EURY|nr:DUF4129 domain-containing protein [Halobiforma nitratireducens]EMA41733.1 hypothetical protein C446_05440 [Halobiforma nitratireducens JCM 10879]
MTRNRRPLLIRLVAAFAGIVAIALAAATVDSPVEMGGDGVSTGEGEGEPSGIITSPPEQQPVEPVGFPPFLEYLLYALLLVAAVIIVWYLLTHRRDALFALALFLGFLLVVYVIIQFTDPVALPGEEATEGMREGGSDGFGEGDSGGPTVEPLLGLLALLLAIVVGGLLLARGGDDDRSSAADSEELPDDRDSPSGHAAAVGNAAGRAADRLESATDVDNEIYRAWREMTRPLEVNRPDSSTPREFARAAVDAGIDRDHVEELTGLFEDVRYGDADATPEREKRATTVLRRIEDAYAERERDANASADPTEAEADADEEAGGGWWRLGR